MENSHVMDSTNKIVTIIGLVLEGLGALSLLIFMALWEPYMELVSLAETDMTAEEFDILMSFMDFVYVLIVVIGIILTVAFLINLFFFTKLVKGRLSDATAKKVYLYQAIWGGVSILFNQITGILYLVSGVRGFNNQREETDIRDGI